MSADKWLVVAIILALVAVWSADRTVGLLVLLMAAAAFRIAAPPAGRRAGGETAGDTAGEQP